MSSFKVVISVSKECNLCGECIKYCPTDVFELSDNKLVIHQERCIYCRGCEVLCPKKAIKVELLNEGLEIIIKEPLIKTENT